MLLSVSFSSSYLGAQQKSSHNLRLLCGNILSFCQHAEGGSALESGTMRLNPCRIQSALSLYTADISAIIITVDQEVNAVMGMKEGFSILYRSIYLST